MTGCLGGLVDWLPGCLVGWVAGWHKYVDTGATAAAGGPLVAQVSAVAAAAGAPDAALVAAWLVGGGWAGWLSGCLVGWLAGWAVGWLAGWLVGWLAVASDE